MTDRLSQEEAARFIRQWNDSMIRQNGGVVITPNGELDEETLRQIAIAEAAGHQVEYVTRPGTATPRTGGDR